MEPDPSKPGTGTGTATGTTNGAAIRLLLMPMVDMPSPKLSAAIVSIKKVVDGIVLLNINNKAYIQYQIVVRQSALEWVIARRFSDFVKLHLALQQQDPSESGAIAASAVPALPQKYISNKFISTSDPVVSYRRRELQLFIDRLLAFNKREANHHGTIWCLWLAQPVCTFPGVHSKPY